MAMKGIIQQDIPKLRQLIAAKNTAEQIADLSRKPIPGIGRRQCESDIDALAVTRRIEMLSPEEVLQNLIRMTIAGPGHCGAAYDTLRDPVGFRGSEWAKRLRKEEERPARINGPGLWHGHGLETPGAIQVGEAVPAADVENRLSVAEPLCT